MTGHEGTGRDGINDPGIPPRTHLCALVFIIAGILSLAAMGFGHLMSAT